MKALSDSNRIKMIKLLLRCALCVCETQEALGLAQPTAGRHLKILEEVSLMTYPSNGLWVNYCLTDRERNPYAANLLGSLRHWLDEDSKVDAPVAWLPQIRREFICGG